MMFRLSPVMNRVNVFCFWTFSGTYSADLKSLKLAGIRLIFQIGPFDRIKSYVE